MSCLHNIQCLTKPFQISEISLELLYIIHNSLFEQRNMLILRLLRIYIIDLTKNLLNTQASIFLHGHRQLVWRKISYQRSLNAQMGWCCNLTPVIFLYNWNSKNQTDPVPPFPIRFFFWGGGSLFSLQNHRVIKQSPDPKFWNSWIYYCEYRINKIL